MRWLSSFAQFENTLRDLEGKVTFVDVVLDLRSIATAVVRMHSVPECWYSRAHFEFGGLRNPNSRAEFRNWQREYTKASLRLTLPTLLFLSPNTLSIPGSLLLKTSPTILPR